VLMTTLLEVTVPPSPPPLAVTLYVPAGSARLYPPLDQVVVVPMTTPSLARFAVIVTPDKPSPGV